MALKGKINRKLSAKEYVWLKKTLKKGKVVYLYTGQTFGCVSDDGVAITRKPDKTPFFEVPRDAVDWDDD